MPNEHNEQVTWLALTENILLNWLARVYTKNLMVIRKVFEKSSTWDCVLQTFSLLKDKVIQSIWWY